MRLRPWSLAGAIVLAATWLALPVRAQDSCAASYVLAPDRSSLAILFDNLVVEGAGRMSCSIDVDLNLSADTSLGVYRVDYRGYANLAKKDVATLEVDFNLGPKGNSRKFKRSVRGAMSDEFAFTENIGAGLMKRVGCGDDAHLTGEVRLSLQGAPEGLVSLDSGDGSSRRGLEYKFDLRKC